MEGKFVRRTGISVPQVTVSMAPKSSELHRKQPSAGPLIENVYIVTGCKAQAIWFFEFEKFCRNQTLAINTLVRAKSAVCSKLRTILDIDFRRTEGLLGFSSGTNQETSYVCVQFIARVLY